jgi:DNA-binding response OmpR family regulator
VNESASKRVLVVEDEWLLADSLAIGLQELGLVVLGPASDTTTSAQLIEAGRPDVAILDVHLGGGETSFDIARELSKRRIPFAFLTGYAHGSLPQEFAKVPLILKPAPFDEISSVVTLLLEQRKT